MQFSGSFSSRLFLCTVAVSGALLLSSCNALKNQLDVDRAAEANTQDFIDILAPRPLPSEEQAIIPDFQSIVSTPEDLKLPSPLVTVSVNQRVGLRDLIFELADQAGVDVEIDPQIRGSIIFTAKDRPFDQVVQRICDLAGLRYTYDDNILRVELDRPYIKNYPVDFLSAERTGSTSVNTSLSLGSGSSEGGSTTGGGSQSSVDTKVDGSLWQELDKNIEQILSSSDTYISLATLEDPVAMPVNPTPAPVAPPGPDGQPAAQLPPLPGDPRVAPMPAAVPPQLNVTSVAQTPPLPNPPATYSISRQSGIVSVFANERQQKQVARYIEEFRKRVTTQVLIEARVLQVELKDEFAAGIDWNQFNLTGLASITSDFGRPLTAPGLTAGTTPFTARLVPGNDLQATISAISRFGTVRTLSSPRITVVNNQPAIVNVTQDNVFFNFEVSTETDDNGNKTVNVESEQKSAPEGVILNVIPNANPDTSDIIMSVRPSITKITSEITDPTIAISLAAAGVTSAELKALLESINSKIPEVSVQEMDSVLRMQSGQTMILGGLMRDSNAATEEKVPVLGDVPLVGNLFKNHIDTIQKSEIVIFITARIVPGGNADNTDRELYKSMSLDRRPVRF
jgi:general secretion pathway protein D